MRLLSSGNVVGAGECIRILRNRALKCTAINAVLGFKLTSASLEHLEVPMEETT
jgi:hypothetical protein